MRDPKMQKIVHEPAEFMRELEPQIISSEAHAYFLGAIAALSIYGQKRANRLSQLYRSLPDPSEPISQVMEYVQ